MSTLAILNRIILRNVTKLIGGDADFMSKQHDRPLRSEILQIQLSDRLPELDRDEIGGVKLVDGDVV
ncbi:hypothetical protein [Alkalinema sp. FACHB-956]|uniref:hypothetical protein n=1 Tax=Alkalinema sp. FACHB-956 TaxID=2692768 RepID=UPI0016895E96|nr:hypothetical protein [Alkalinema sp. FACHB-956]MBD2325311.1 hypothetical protein [Alkalinema sp. FACHB-956]